MPDEGTSIASTATLAEGARITASAGAYDHQMNDKKLLPLSEVGVDSTAVDFDGLTVADDEEPYVAAAFAVLRDVAVIVVVLASISRRTRDGRPNPLTRDEAVLGGLVVRITKLLHGLLGAAAQNRAEITNYFTRGVLETAINIRYLIQRDSLEAFEAFVAHSFRNDKRLLEVIARAVGKRGSELPVEKRIRSSIYRTLARSGLTVDDVPTANTDAWPSFEERLRALEMKEAYGGVFGGPSQYIHGTWHELLAYNLTEVDGGFELDTSWGATRPQSLLGLAAAVAMAAVEYIDFLFANYAEAPELKERLLEAVARARRIDNLHEDFLTRDA